MKDLDYTHFVPGTNYEYINPTYVLLGDIVSKVSGMPFTQYMEQYVFRPAKMKSTLYFDRNHQDRIPNIAHAYEYGDLSKMGEEHDASAASRGCKRTGMNMTSVKRLSLPHAPMVAYTHPPTSL